MGDDWQEVFWLLHLLLHAAPRQRYLRVARTVRSTRAMRVHTSGCARWEGTRLLSTGVASSYCGSVRPGHAPGAALPCKPRAAPAGASCRHAPDRLLIDPAPGLMAPGSGRPAC